MHHTTAPVVMVAANVRHMACSTARSNPPSLIRLAPVQGVPQLALGRWERDGQDATRHIKQRLPERDEHFLAPPAVEPDHPVNDGVQFRDLGQNFGCRLIAKRLLLAA